MKFIFNSKFISTHECLFWIYLIIMALIILLTIIWVIKEIKNNENK